MNILQAIDDPEVFGRHFRGSTWTAAALQEIDDKLAEQGVDYD